MKLQLCVRTLEEKKNGSGGKELQYLKARQRRVCLQRKLRSSGDNKTSHRRAENGREQSPGMLRETEIRTENHPFDKVTGTLVKAA